MADPLAQTVEDFAPEQLHLFDTAQAGNILSRYADVSRAYDTRQQVERDRLSREQAQFSLDSARKREERDRLLESREDAEYREKQEARTSRAGLLGDLMDLDEADDAFDDNVIGLLKEAPPALQEDETVKDILRAKRDKAERIRQEKERARLAGQRDEYAMKKLEYQSKNRELMGALTDKDWASLPRDPETGQPDMQAALSLAYQRKYETRDREDAARVARRAEAAKALQEGRNSAAEAKSIYIYDDEAYPSTLEAARQQLIKSNPDKARALADDEAFKILFPEEFRKAEAADKNRYPREVLTARKFEDRDDYINLIPGLSPEGQEIRGMFWDAANRGGDVGPPEEAKPKSKEKKTEPPDAVPEKVKALPKEGKEVTLDGKRYKVFPDGTYKEL